jgi:imidazolonepropionase-like amidohydrolase
MKKLLSITLAGCTLLTLGLHAQKAPKSSYLFTHVKIYDGLHDTLLQDREVLVEGNRIVKIAKQIPTNRMTQIIDGKEGVLMPGLIDAHTHLMVT